MSASEVPEPVSVDIPIVGNPSPEVAVSGNPDPQVEDEGSVTPEVLLGVPMVDTLVQGVAPREQRVPRAPEPKRRLLSEVMAEQQAAMQREVDARLADKAQTEDDIDRMEWESPEESE